MAARNRPGLSEATRKRIQTTMLVKRLEGHVKGEHDLTATQVSAALGLLRKTLPDLAVVEHSGEVSVASDATAALRALNGNTEPVRQGADSPDPGVASDSGDVRH